MRHGVSASDPYTPFTSSVLTLINHTEPARLRMFNCATNPVSAVWDTNEFVATCGTFDGLQMTTMSPVVGVIFHGVASVNVVPPPSTPEIVTTSPASAPVSTQAILRSETQHILLEAQCRC